VVDHDDRAVLLWRLARGATEAERITAVLIWRPAGASTDFVLALNNLFATTF
jgi:hypothetical protein